MNISWIFCLLGLFLRSFGSHDGVSGFGFSHGWDWEEAGTTAFDLFGFLPFLYLSPTHNRGKTAVAYALAHFVLIFVSKILISKHRFISYGASLSLQSSWLGEKGRQCWRQSS